MIAIYARVSTEEQARNGYSLKDQIRACRKLAGSDEVIEYIDDGVSGEILDRPELSRLRRDISAGLINKVLCLDPDRLSRKLMNQLILSEEIEKKAELLFVNGDYGQSAEGRLFYQLRGAISEFEKAKINERMSRGRKEKARQGKVVRDYSIYGYNYDSNVQKLVVNPFEAEIVRMIFSSFTGSSREISGINGIAKYLTQLGIPTKRGAKVWHRQVVRQILMNRAYIGEFYQNRWNCEGMLVNKYKAPESRVPLRLRPENEWILVNCPQIVDRKIFIYAQQLMEESRRRWSGSSKNKYLLSGLIRCSACGNTLTGRKALNWGKTVYEYSDLKGTSGSQNRGCGFSIKAEILDKLVWETVLQEIESSGIASLPLFTAPASDNDGIEHKLSEIQKARSNLFKIIASISDEIGSKALEEIKLKLKELKEQEELLINMKSLKANRDIDTNAFQKALSCYLSRANELLDFDDRQIIIRNMVKVIMADADEIIIKGF